MHGLLSNNNIVFRINHVNGLEIPDAISGIIATWLMVTEMVCTACLLQLLNVILMLQLPKCIIGVFMQAFI